MIIKSCRRNSFGLETVKDVYEEFLKDRRDPLYLFEKPLLKSDILNIDNLRQSGNGAWRNSKKCC